MFLANEWHTRPPKNTISLVVSVSVSQKCHNTWLTTSVWHQSTNFVLDQSTDQLWKALESTITMVKSKYVFYSSSFIPKPLLLRGSQIPGQKCAMGSEVVVATEMMRIPSKTSLKLDIRLSWVRAWSTKHHSCCAVKTFRNLGEKVSKDIVHHYLTKNRISMIFQKTKT